MRALASRLESVGARVRWDEALLGVTRFYTEDPFGNRIELLAEGIAAPGAPEATRTEAAGPEATRPEAAEGGE